MVILFYVAAIHQTKLNKIKRISEFICVQVFDKMANFVAGDEMFTIQNPDVERSVAALILTRKINFKKLPLKPGDCLEIVGDCICNDNIIFNIGKAVPFETNFKLADMNNWDEERLMNAAFMVKSQIVTSSHNGVGIGNCLIYEQFKPLDLVQQKFVRLITPFERTNQWQIDQFTRTIDQIIGLGPGLTPSGDDFLIGFLSVIRFFSENSQIKHHLNQIEERVESLLIKTTVVSKAFLSGAIDGQFAQSICLYYEALDNEDKTLQHRSLEKIAQHGSSSGVDTLNGILFGIKWIMGNLKQANH